MNFQALCTGYSKGSGRREFRANYRKTLKNENAGKVFDEMKFKIESENEGVSFLVFEYSKEIPNYDFIEVSKEIE